MTFLPVFKTFLDGKFDSFTAKFENLSVSVSEIQKDNKAFKEGVEARLAAQDEHIQKFLEHEKWSESRITEILDRLQVQEEKWEAQDRTSKVMEERVAKA